MRTVIPVYRPTSSSCVYFILFVERSEEIYLKIYIKIFMIFNLSTFEIKFFRFIFQLDMKSTLVPPAVWMLTVHNLNQYKSCIIHFILYIFSYHMFIL
jgi:hypothetical protein